MAGEEERETLHGSPQRAPDVQDLHEAAAAVTQVNTPRPFFLSWIGSVKASEGQIKSDVNGWRLTLQRRINF